MYKKVISGFEAMRRNFVPRKILVVRKTVVRLLGRTNRRILFEFLIMIGMLSSVGIIAASRWSATTIASRGNLRVDGVGVYNDLNYSVATTYLDWGTLEPGATRSIALFVRNEGNYASTLFLTTDNWNPLNASSYIGLSWNYDGRTLNPLDVLDVTLTLSISSGAENISSFSFDVIIGINK